MKVLLLNGSPRTEGNTNLALNEIAKQLEKNGIETQIMQIGTKSVPDEPKARPHWTVKGCRRCAPWPTTWLSC